MKKPIHRFHMHRYAVFFQKALAQNPINRKHPTLFFGGEPFSAQLQDSRLAAVLPFRPATMPNTSYRRRKYRRQKHRRAVGSPGSGQRPAVRRCSGLSATPQSVLTSPRRTRLTFSPGRREIAAAIKRQRIGTRDYFSSHYGGTVGESTVEASPTKFSSHCGGTVTGPTWCWS